MRVGIAAVLVAAVAAIPSATAAGGSTQGWRTALEAGAPSTVDRPGAPFGRSAGTPHLDSALAQVARVAASSGRAAALGQATALGLVPTPAAVRVVVTGRTPSAAVAAVQAAGGQLEAVAGLTVAAQVSPTALAGLAGSSGVTFVAPPARPVAQAVAGEEVGSAHADAWQGAGVTGSGVKVAIIDLGFGGLASAQSNGDLGSVTTQDDCGGAFSTATNHGTAVAEIVHEIAPGAQLYLACVDDPASLLTAEQWAVAQGVSVINHSVAWFGTARGDGSGGPGTPDGVVDDAAAHGVLWVNAAGNYAQQHWSGTYTDNGGYEDFGGGDLGDSVFIPGGAQFCAELRWNEWSGTPADDYDLYVAQQGTNTVVASSTNDQSAGAPPVEEACFTPPADGFYFVSINRFSGSGTPRLDLWTVGGGASQYEVAAGSVTDPAASPNALAVGAVCWNDGSLEPYSSQGPTIDGRNKPDLAGDDRMSSFTYGAFDSCGGASGFAGTSAASPTVVGLAALVKQLYPSDTAAQLRAYLTSHALDEGSPGTDPQYGAGRALLPSALSAPLATAAPSTSGNPKTSSTLTGAPGTWSGDGDIVFSYQWQRCDANGANCGSATSSQTYNVTNADLGSRLKLTVTGTSLLGSSAATYLTRVIAATAPPLNLVLPVVFGSPRVGSISDTNSGAWDPGTAPTSFVDQWESCSNGSCTVVGSGFTYTPVASDLGNTLRVVVTGTNPDGSVSATSPDSPPVQPAASGGGGGGGGGGGSVPDLAVAVSGPAAVSVGGQAVFSLAVSDLNGATANGIHLVVALPAGATVAAVSSDRGSGCTPGPGSVDCNLDFLSGTLVAHVTLVLALATPGAATVTATVKAAQADSNAANNSASATVQVGSATTTTTTPPPPRAPAAADHINGSAKADRLTGTGKADVIRAGAGNDWVNGGAGNDTIYGGPGNDILYGGTGADLIFGGTGNDTIHSADGVKDSIDCGPGHDVVFADKKDKIAKNCELVHRK